MGSLKGFRYFVHHIKKVGILSSIFKGSTYTLHKDQQPFIGRHDATDRRNIAKRTIHYILPRIAKDSVLQLNAIAYLVNLIQSAAIEIFKKIFARFLQRTIYRLGSSLAYYRVRNSFGIAVTVSSFNRLRNLNHQRSVNFRV